MSDTQPDTEAVPTARLASTVPTLSEPTDIGQTASFDGNDYVVYDANPSAEGVLLRWAQLVYESPDGKIQYDPPIQRPLPTWNAAPTVPTIPIDQTPVGPMVALVDDLRALVTQLRGLSVGELAALTTELRELLADLRAGAS